MSGAARAFTGYCCKCGAGVKLARTGYLCKHGRVFCLSCSHDCVEIDDEKEGC